MYVHTYVISYVIYDSLNFLVNDTKVNDTKVTNSKVNETEITFSTG